MNESEYTANLEKEQERSAARTVAQAKAFEALVAIVKSYGDPALSETTARGIATEVLVVLQDEDGGLMPLVDATRDHRAAKAGVRADRLERQVLAARKAEAEINAAAARANGEEN